MISIILTVFNQENVIEKTIRSVLAQTSNDYELVIINDGSTDSSEKIIKTILSVNKIRYNYLKINNAGVSNARNVGIINSKGDYLLFLDGDDMINDNLVATLIPYTRKSIDLISFKYQIINEEDIITTTHDSFPVPKKSFFSGPELFSHLILRTENYFVLWNSSIIYNREFIIQNKIFYTLNIHPAEDTEFQLKSIYSSCSAIYINKCLSSYRSVEGSSMNSYNINRLGAYLAMMNVIKFIKDKNYNPNQYLKKTLTRLNNQALNGFLYNYSYNFNSLDDSYKSKTKIKHLNTEIEIKFPGITKKYRSNLFKSIFSEFSIQMFLKKSLHIVFIISPLLGVKIFTYKFKL